MARTRRPSSALEQFERPAKKARKAKTNAKQPQSAEVKTGIDIYPNLSPWHVGAHVSVVGGGENAVLNAASIGANAFALFLKSPRQWASGGLNPSSIENFKARMKEYHYDPRDVLPHGSYLINLGNPDAEKRQKSYECFVDDLNRCEQLGLEVYNFHPGSPVGATTTGESIALIAECLNRAHAATTSVVTVLENLAGSGHIIGSDFSHLADIIAAVKNKA